MDFGKIIGSIAPFLGAAIGGPFGGMAGKIIGGIFGTKDTDEETLQKAFSEATPDQLLAIKKAENDFAIQMQELGFQNVEALEKIAADDRASARARQVSLRDRTPEWLAYGYGLMFFVTLGAFVWMAFSNIEIPAGVKTSIDIMLGAEIGMVLGAKEYFFGSSSGSRAKDDTITKLSQ